MNLQTDFRVTFLAAGGLIGPDALSLFSTQIGPILDSLLRAGQIGVAIFTCIYIYRKGQAIKPRKRKSKTKSHEGPKIS